MNQHHFVVSAGRGRGYDVIVLHVIAPTEWQAHQHVIDVYQQDYELRADTEIETRTLVYDNEEEALNLMRNIYGRTENNTSERQRTNR